ncbi:MAG TPA: GspH/FimT family pseudopilin [Burkholderiaceae bacterium]|nr:GspH/FimT family pseudopilin [Burkholderiaceae bacterium]
MRGRSAGFTLIELLTVIMIVAVLAGLAVPEFNNTLSARRVQASASALSHGLKAAQTEAIRRNRTVELIFTNAEPLRSNTVSAAPVSSASASGWIARTIDPANDDDFVAGGRISEGGPTTVTVADPTTAVGFTAMGRPVNRTTLPQVALAQPVVFRVTDTGSSRRMCVSLSTGGAVRVCDPQRPAGSAAACEPMLPPGAC